MFIHPYVPLWYSQMAQSRVNNTTGNLGQCCNHSSKLAVCPSRAGHQQEDAAFVCVPACLPVYVLEDGIPMNALTCQSLGCGGVLDFMCKPIQTQTPVIECDSATHVLHPLTHITWEGCHTTCVGCAQKGHSCKTGSLRRGNNCKEARAREQETSTVLYVCYISSPVS